MVGGIAPLMRTASAWNGADAARPACEVDEVPEQVFRVQCLRDFVFEGCSELLVGETQGLTRHVQAPEDSLDGTGHMKDLNDQSTNIESFVKDLASYLQLLFGQPNLRDLRIHFIRWLFVRRHQLLWRGSLILVLASRRQTAWTTIMTTLTTLTTMHASLVLQLALQHALLPLGVRGPRYEGAGLAEDILHYILGSIVCQEGGQKEKLNL